jgi:hypothetical protein
MSRRDLEEEMRKEAIEHRDMILDLRAVLATASGVKVFKYLFKHLGVAELPELGLTGELLMDKLGYLRAGNAVFKLVSEANMEVSGQIVSQIEKEKYEQIYSENYDG